jgi:YD repeat-containing protein
MTQTAIPSPTPRAAGGPTFALPLKGLPHPSAVFRSVSTTDDGIMRSLLLPIQTLSPMVADLPPVSVHGMIRQVDNAGTDGTFPIFDQLYNLTSKTDRKNQTIQDVYDSLYRMTSKTYPDQTAASYAYDLVGKIQRAASPLENRERCPSPHFQTRKSRVLGTGMDVAFHLGRPLQKAPQAGALNPHKFPEFQEPDLGHLDASESLHAPQ